MLKLGYREHEDFELGVRFTQGQVAALTAAARQLVQYGVDLIIADSDESALAAQQATSRIPIVFTSVADPVGLGLIRSFARPGGNITGVSDLELQLAPKRPEARFPIDDKINLDARSRAPEIEVAILPRVSDPRPEMLRHQAFVGTAVDFFRPVKRPART